MAPPFQEPVALRQNSVFASRAAGSPLRHWIPVVVFVLVLTLYMVTLCPTIYPGDGAELTAAAWCLGVPHPTGYPLFMVLGHLVQRVGIGSPAFSMNFVTAVFGALATVGAFRFMRELMRLLMGRRRARQMPWRYLAAASALAMGTSATWWGQSNQTEVYSLLMVFVAFAWAMGLRVIRTGSRRSLWGLALLSGMAFLHHQVFVVTVPLSFLALIAVCRKPKTNREEDPPKRCDAPSPSRVATVLVAGILFLLPLAGYVYLPLRASSHPPLNWGNPRGLEGILWHLTGKQYSSTRVLALDSGAPMNGAQIREHLRNRALDIAQWMGEQYFRPDDPRHPEEDPALAVFGLIVCFVSLFGFACLWRRSRWAALGLGLGVFLNLFFAMVYTILDIETYQMPMWLAIASLALAGAVAMPESLPPRHDDPARQEKRRRLRAWIAGTVALGLAGGSIVAYYPESADVNKAHATQAWDYAHVLLSGLPPGAVMFTNADCDLFPLWYAQVVEGRRPDVAVVGANLVLSSWYGDQLETTLPEGIEVFVGKEPLANSNQWLVAFLGGTVAPQILAGRSVYITIPDPLIGQYYDLRPAFTVPGPFPRSAMQLLTVYEVRDLDNFSVVAREQFREEFPVVPEGRIVRRSSRSDAAP
ncbi:DUF2723 domain-containing protein [Candidatus Sumerlaeota bacterium]|nr:DUF2723 domain-containing protein [Candidatus Sumerlaeota bacterium]